MANIEPLVSVVIPCYNQGKYLREAVQSVQDQTYSNLQIIIVNDGATDNTQTLAQDLAKTDHLIALISIANGGLANARNTGIAWAKGDFILPLDADDKLNSAYISAAIKAFTAQPELRLVYGLAEKFGAEQGPWKLPTFSLKTLATRNPIYCSAIFRKIDWQRVGGYDTKMRYGFEDWEFWIALLKDGGKVLCLDRVCFYYRTAADSMLKRINSEQQTALFDYLSVKHADFYVAQLGNFQQLAQRGYDLELRLARLTNSKTKAMQNFWNSLFAKNSNKDL